MLLRIASDLHLEGFSNPATTLLNVFLPPDPRDAAAILILAGDISSSVSQLLEFLKLCEPRFRRVIYVPGNHELYRHNMQKWNADARALFDAQLTNTDTVHTAEVKSTIIDDTQFIFGMLWGDGGPTLSDQANVGWYLNDFRLITMTCDRDGTSFVRRFTVTDMQDLYRKQKETIESILEEPFDGKRVVVTHHLPSRHLVSARFWPGDGSDGANGGFVGACDNILAGDSAPALWVHGHTHDSIDTTLWKTRIVCNPAGYRGEWSTEFNSFMVSGATVPFFIEL